jgi:peptide subunit release factor 1 (eRF1)
LAVALVSGCKCEFYAISTLDEKYTKNELLYSFEENLPNKHRRGGQSSARFGRIHDQTVERYAKKIAENITELYKNHSVYKLILAGPAEIKHKVCLYLSPTFCKFKPILHDTAEIVESTLIEVLDKYVLVLSDMRNHAAVEAITKFENYVICEPDMLVFGQETIAAFREGRLQTLFVEGKMNMKLDIIKSKCNIVVLPIKYEFCKRYGSMCGILYYSASNTYSLDHNM